MFTLLHWQELDASERHAARIVEFAGGEIRFVGLDGGSLVSGTSPDYLVPSGDSVLVRAGALTALLNRHPSGTGILRTILRRASQCLVYGFEPVPEHNRLLRELTADGLVGVAELPAGNASFSVSADAREVCRQFSGLSLGRTNPAQDLVFQEGANPVGCVPLIRIGKRPFLVSMRSQGGDLYLLACRQIADLDETMPAGGSLTSFFSQLAPLLMFVRRAAGDRCWHNDTPHACLIIDDPLLRKAYGFLDYEKLLDLMECENFSTTIAFIPWNYKRSKPRTVELFKSHPQRLALCVHGCDHTGGEFGSMNPQVLQSRAREGLRRMERHRELSGIGFDDVMVFPQGCFSTGAMAALKSCDYLAAVNSSAFPVDGDGHVLRLKDLLDGAVTRFSGFPLFTRHYPQDRAGLAFALFLGKPPLLVEHHGYFRNGYEPLADVVRTLKRMDPNLEWGRLAAVCSQAHLKRRSNNGDIHVRFFTDRFSLRNNTGAKQRYVLFQRQAAGDSPQSATMDGMPVVFDRVADDLMITAELTAGQVAEIRLRRSHPATSTVECRPGVARRAGVLARRYLSEFRDTHVDRNPLLSRLALRMRNGLVGNSRS